MDEWVKAGRKGGVDYVVPSDLRDGHVAHTQQYPVEEVVLDLLHVAAHILKL